MSYAQVHNWDNLLLAYCKAARGKRGVPGTAAFEHRLEDYLFLLEDELASKRYRPGPYVSFTIHDPKTRRISAAPFRDALLRANLVRVTGALRGFSLALVQVSATPATRGVPQSSPPSRADRTHRHTAMAHSASCGPRQGPVPEEPNESSEVCGKSAAPDCADRNDAHRTELIPRDTSGPGYETPRPFTCCTSASRDEPGRSNRHNPRREAAAWCRSTSGRAFRRHRHRHRPARSEDAPR